jgi:hypothetical protein
MLFKHIALYLPGLLGKKKIVVFQVESNTSM